MRQKLAHLRHPDTGSALWAGAEWLTPGPAPTIQIHSAPEETLPYGATRLNQYGTDDTPAVYSGQVETPTKHPVMTSFFLSSPYIFQSYFKVHWEDMFGAQAQLKQGARRLSPLANPNARGKAEGQALMDYNPWPSASQLVPSYPGAELKAV